MGPWIDVAAAMSHVYANATARDKAAWMGCHLSTLPRQYETEICYNAASATVRVTWGTTLVMPVWSLPERPTMFAIHLVVFVRKERHCRSCLRASAGGNTPIPVLSSMTPRKLFHANTRRYSRDSVAYGLDRRERRHSARRALGRSRGGRREDALTASRKHCSVALPRFAHPWCLHPEPESLSSGCA